MQRKRTKNNENLQNEKSKDNIYLSFIIKEMALYEIDDFPVILLNQIKEINPKKIVFVMFAPKTEFLIFFMESGKMFYKKIDSVLVDYFMDNEINKIGIINTSPKNIDSISPIVKTFYNIEE